MKTLVKIFLISSLAANAVLLGFWMRRADGMAPMGSSTSSKSADGKAVTGSSQFVGMAANDAVTWASLQTDVSDPKELLAKLRELGFPPEVARAIISARIADSYIARRNEIIASEPVMSFAGPRSTTFSIAVANKLQALSRERSEKTREVLGSESKVDISEDERLMYSFLPASKITDVAQIVSDYDSLRSQLYTEMSGVRLPEDREKMKLLESEMHTDLAAILTPEEMTAYDLQRSRTAQSLRWSLGNFDATEAEYKTIFQYKQAYDEKYSTSYGPLNGDLFNESREAQKKMNEEIKGALGEARYAEYERSQDYSYKAADQIAKHFNLPAENAVQVYNMQKTYQSQLMQIKGSAEERAVAQASFYNQTVEKLNALLTPAGVAAYREVGGYWLREPKPPQPAPSVAK